MHQKVELVALFYVWVEKRACSRERNHPRIFSLLRANNILYFFYSGGELDTDTKHIENVLEACRRNEEIVSLSQLTEEKYAFLWILPESQARPYNHSWIATLTEILRTTPDFDQNNLASVLISFSNSQHLRYSNFEMLLRDLLNVNDKEAKLTDMMVFLGREKTIQRLRRHIYLMSQISSIQLLQLGGHVNDENRQ